MRVPDEKLAEVWDRGWTVVEGFVDPETLADARKALWKLYPTPETFFARPERYQEYTISQFAGVRPFPYPTWSLNRLTVYPDLIDAAERFLGSDDIEIYKAELWAKYAGAINYDQPYHFDFPNHSLVAPRADGVHIQMTTFILLSDVTEADSPTKMVPLEHTRDLPYFPIAHPQSAFADREVAATGPAGSLIIYRTDVLHRGSDFTQPNRSRFVMMVDLQQRGWRWNGKMSWPGAALNPDIGDAMIAMTPRERDLYGWPPPGSDYWNEQTLRDVALRYPGIDLKPYGA
ncbi:MAG: hypothetical protein JWP35_2187 [Caulobacter sp.]|nr:hypothetical protein [Caulobacter sp.]